MFGSASARAAHHRRRSISCQPVAGRPDRRGVARLSVVWRCEDGVPGGGECRGEGGGPSGPPECTRSRGPEMTLRPSRRNRRGFARHVSDRLGGERAEAEGSRAARRAESMRQLRHPGCQAPSHDDRRTDFSQSRGRLGRSLGGEKPLEQGVQHRTKNDRRPATRRGVGGYSNGSFCRR